MNEKFFVFNEEEIADFCRCGWNLFQRNFFCLKMLRQSSKFILIEKVNLFSMSNITARAITPNQEQDFLSAKLQVSIMIYQANLKAA